MVEDRVYESFVLNTIESIKTFVLLNEKSTCEIDVSKGRYSVDGKSIMGMFSLEVSMPLKVVLHGTKDEIEELHNEYVAHGLI